ncbi:hypothetical protein RCF98_05055 [Thiothrix lacustris]|uniref:Uncharacterized protein n=1 Tax=Thiothrix lacustris TaxID=525917 RepID=A0ABY9MST7_9GAMM|nr:hypothetical protein [Thiothrix lacustris]WML91707.1 hypothetical protein RCF98_05055 [Thiothrix lacustris]
MPTDANTAFERLVTRDFDQASLEDVKTVALGLWYQDFIPDFTQLPVTNLQSQRRAGYLVDRLLRYNCVSDERKRALFADVTALKIHLKPAASTKPNVELLAKNWGLDQDLKRLAKELLPYQTRHYQR